MTVREWLESIGLGDYAEAFEANHIDLDLLADLTDDLLEKIGVASVGHRIRLLKAAEAFGAEAAPAAAEIRPPTDAQATAAKYAPAALAEKIRGARDSMRGERKQVTVLFADVKGSFNLIQGMDPEEARALLDPMVTLMMRAVHAYEGTVNDVLGDGIMAMFGAPIAHEDHALRACRAALEMIEKAAARAADAAPGDAARMAQLRVGMHSGEVVVRAINNDLTMSYSAIGQTTHLASRMEQLAGPGTIHFTGDTLRLVDGLVTYEDCGQTDVKGLDAPIETFQLLGLTGARSRLEAAGTAALTPFVGRDRELGALENRLSAVEKGQGRVVLISGDPGVGKSRLLHEFRARVDKRAYWVEGRCISFGQAMAFHPLVDLMRKNFRLDEEDDIATARTKVAEGLKRISPELASRAPYLQHLMGIADPDDAVVDLDPKVRRTEMLQLMLRALLLASERKPQILVFEDLHWSDTATTEVLGHLVDNIPSSRILMIGTIRTGYPSPFEARSFVTRLAVENLGTGESDRVVEAVLGADNLPSNLKTLVQRKAEGNPFFVEELVKSLRETGAIRQDGDHWSLGRPADQILVPDTIQGVLASRIDRLEDESRHTLQLASVIGREFTQRLLDRIADMRDSTSESLRALQAIELIHQKALYPELAYMFKHALAQDVAYGSLLVQRRRELHRQVAHAIEELYGERLEDHYAVIAHHFAAAQDWAEAADYFDKAADHAADACAMREAITLVQAALDALDQVDLPDKPALTFSLLSKCAGYYMLLSQFGEAHQWHGKAAAVAEQAGNLEQEGLAQAAMSVISLFDHRFDAATEEAGKAVQLGQAVNNDDIIAAGTCSEAWVETVNGRLDNVELKFESSAQLATNGFFASLAGAGITFTSTWRGAYDVAVSTGKKTVNLARDGNHTFPLLFAQMGLGLSYAAKGAYDDAYGVFNGGLELAGKIGDEIFRNRLLNSLGWIHAECGDVRGAIVLNEQARDFSTERGDPETIANAELNLADAFLARGEPAAAKEWFTSVERLAGNPKTSLWMKWRYSQHLFAGYGEAYLALDDPRKAADFAGQCLDLATRTNSKKYQVRALRLMARIAIAKRQPEEAAKAFAQAALIAEQIKNPAQLWRTHRAMADFLEEHGRKDQASKSRQTAQSVLLGLAENLQHPELSSAFRQRHGFDPAPEPAQNETTAP